MNATLLTSNQLSLMAQLSLMSIYLEETKLAFSKTSTLPDVIVHRIQDMGSAKVTIKAQLDVENVVGIYNVSSYHKE